MSVRKIAAASLVCSLLGLGHASAAPIWIEGPTDAGDLTTTAQSTTGSGTLTSIQGTLDLLNSADDYLDIDLFEIFIKDAAAFSATTVDAITNVSDPQLFLFDASGAGVFMNDDGFGIGSQSALGALPGGFGAGFYFLGIGWFGNLALDALSLEIFDAAGSPTGAGPLAGWDLSAFNRQDPAVNYEIILTGVPEPMTLTLLGAGLAAVFARRRATSSRTVSGA